MTKHPILIQSPTYLLIAFVLLNTLGCQRRISDSAIQGEWAADNAFLYLNVHGDSLSFYGNAFPIVASEQGSVLDNSIGARFEPPSSPDAFIIGNENELIVHSNTAKPDTLGILSLKSNQLFIRRQKGYPATLLRPMKADSSIKLKKIQFSAGACLGDCPVYDVEIRPNLITVVEPRGQWMSGFPVKRETFVGPYNQREFLSIEALVRKSLIHDSKEIFQRGVRLENEIPVYALTIFYDDTLISIRGDAFHFPPEFAPLIPYLGPPRQYARLARSSTSLLSVSRLCLMTDYQDSLTYLEGVDSKHFRAARFPGGDDAFQSFLRNGLGSFVEIHGTFSFFITINESGFLEEARPAHWDTSRVSFEPYRQTLLRSPRWQAPLYDGRPTRVTFFACFYNEDTTR